MEGLYIPMLKLIEEGTVNETLMAMIRANTRLPIDTVGDTYSLAACNDVGCQRLVEMMEEFGLDDLDRSPSTSAQRRAAVLAEIAKLPRGLLVQRDDHRRLRWAGHAAGRAHGQRQGHPRRLRGHHPQSRYGINVPLAYTTAYTVFGLGCMVASPIPTTPARSGR